MANENQNFLPVNSKEWKLVDTRIAASTAMEEGAAVYADGSGTHDLCTNATGNFRGILAEPIAATDSDYATDGKLKKVYVPKTDEAELYFTVGAGTFTVADIGDTILFNDSISLAADAAGTQAKITGYINSTRGRCVLNKVIS